MRATFAMAPARVLAVHPAAVPVGVVFLLPDRQPVLDLVDDLATGSEGLRAVRRRDADPDRHVADRKLPSRWTQRARERAVAGDRRFDDAFASAIASAS